MKLCLSLAIFLTMAETVLMATQVGNLYCLRDGTSYTMTLFIYKKADPLTLVYAVDKDGNRDSTCDNTAGSSNYITENVGDSYYRIDVRYTGLTQQSISACGAEQINAGLSEYTWRFKARTESLPTYDDIIFGTDMDYEATCNFDTVSENLVAQRSIEVTGTTSTTLSKLDEAVDFQVRLASDDSSVTDVVLGTDIYLNLLLTPVTDGATGVYAHSCQACDTADCSSSVPLYALTDIDGCYLDGTHLGSVGDDSFVGVTPLTSQTLAFENFVFNGDTTDVYFICEIGYCFGTETAECINLCEERTAKRRKRSITNNKESKKNQTIIRRMRIDLGNDGRLHRYIPSIADGTMCLTRLAFTTAAIILAALLVSTIVVSVILYFRLKKVRKTPK